MRYSAPDILRDLENVLRHLQSVDPQVRREAAGELQIVLCGHLDHPTVVKIMDALATRLEVSVNGHAAFVEPDDHVRQRCADGLTLGAQQPADLTPYIDRLRYVEKHDPFDSARHCAGEALEIHDARMSVTHNAPRKHAPTPPALTGRFLSQRT